MYGLNFAFFEDFQHHGENMLYLVQHLGSLNLVEKDDGHHVYFNIFGNKMITFSEAFVKPLMIFTTVCWLCTFVVGYKRKHLTITGTAAGCLLCFIPLLLRYGLGDLSKTVIPNIFTENKRMNQQIGTIPRLFFIVYSMIAWIYQWLVQENNPYNLTMGAWISWVILLIIASFQHPGSSYIFAWPLLLGLLGLNALMFINDAVSWKSCFITMVPAASVILITGPVLYLWYVLLSTEFISVLLAFAVLLSVLFLLIISTFRLQCTAGLSISLLSIGVLIAAFPFL